MFSRWAYVMIGKDKTGKTTLQKNIIGDLCGLHYSRLPRNTISEISNRRFPKSYKYLFTCNRSFQEQNFKTVDAFFKKIEEYLNQSSVAIISSHSGEEYISDVEAIILNLKKRYFNVAGVFFSNAIDRSTVEMTLLPWTEIMMIENGILKDPSAIKEQLSRISVEFADMLLSRTEFQ